jgi:hypothetical protein
MKTLLQASQKPCYGTYNQLGITKLKIIQLPNLKKQYNSKQIKTPNDIKMQLTLFHISKTSQTTISFKAWKRMGSKIERNHHIIAWGVKQ